MDVIKAVLEDDSEHSLVERLVAAETQFVAAILADGLTEASVIETASQAAWFALAESRKCADPHQPRIACKAKCHWCCHPHVTVTAPEVFRIANYIRTRLVSWQQDAVIARLTALLAPAEEETTAAGDTPERTCAYLQGGRCLVYYARPLACQRQTAYRASDCRQAAANGTAGTDVRCERAAVLTHNAAIQGLSDGYQAVMGRGPLAALDITRATHRALTAPDCFDRWLQGEPVFAGCEHAPEDPRH